MSQVNGVAITKRRRYYLAHREEENRYARQYRLKNRDRIHVIDHRHYVNTRDRALAYHKRHRAAIKEEVMRHYSTFLSCQMCGTIDPRVLSIDHVNGGGNAHKKQLGTSNIYYWLKRNGFPSGFQVLCMNCQWIKKAENDENKGCGWRRQVVSTSSSDSEQIDRGSTKHTDE